MTKGMKWEDKQRDTEPTNEKGGRVTKLVKACRIVSSVSAHFNPNPKYKPNIDWDTVYALPVVKIEAG